MRHLFIILSIVLIGLGCNTKNKQGNVSIRGSIKGLKKGTLYLQKVKDTILINLDSLVIEGDPQFTFHTDVQEPEIHYLHLDKHDGAQYNDRIDFFAEPGEVIINTSLNGFEKNVAIVGGKNQMKLQEFKKMNRRFNDRNLRLLKENFEAKKQNDQEKLIENDEIYKRLLKQRYLYTINFAMNNRKLEVAPYITMQEVFDANITYLDTVANSLSKRVRKSKYGKQLIEYIKKRKAEDAEIVQENEKK